MKKSDIFWQSYLSLEKELIEVSKFIYIADVVNAHEGGKEVMKPCDAQLMTFSPHIADLLIRCCVQIEAISKELYYDNGGVKPRGDSSIYFDADCLKQIDIKWATHNKGVMVVAPFFNLTKDENRVLRPLKEAHKRSGTYWEKAYQAVKHDRLASLQYGNVKALLQAMAALYLLNLYLRKDKMLIKYQELSKLDFSMGSAVFAVVPPTVGQLWYGNHPITSESPFVVTFNEEDYNKIEGMQKADHKALNDYWQQQPELKDPEFLSIIAKGLEKEKLNPANRFMHLWELGIYRLGKLLPNSMSFEERKTKLLISEAWNCWVNQNNQHLSPEEITKENIDQEIVDVGRHWGMDIQRSYESSNWIGYALDKANCRLYIP